MSALPDVPQNIEAEVGYMSACFDQHFVLEQEPVPVDDFYLHKNQLLYQGMLDTKLAHGSIDLVTLSNTLERQGNLEAIGGFAYISAVMFAVPSYVFGAQYAKIIRETAKQRRLLDVAGEIARRAYKRDAPDEVINYGVNALQDQGMGSQDVKRADAGALSVISKASHYQTNPLRPGEVRGIDTGWADVNVSLGGWLRGNVYYFLGVPHMGKTWVLINALSRVAARGGRVGLFSLEMSADTDCERYDKSTLWERVVLSNAQIKMDDYRAGTLSQEQYQRLDDVADQVSRWHFWIDDTVSTLADITATIHRENREQQLDVVAIDYLGLIQHERRRGQSENDYLGSVCKALKELSRSTDIALLVPHQVSSKAIATRTNKRPQISDGYNTSFLEQDGDVVVGLYRDGMYNENTEYPNIMEGAVLKNRVTNGTGNYWNWYFSSDGRLSPAVVAAYHP